MGTDMRFFPPPTPDPLEQIARKLEWQRQEIERLGAAVRDRDVEIRRLEALLLGREPR